MIKFLRRDKLRQTETEDRPDKMWLPRPSDMPQFCHQEWRLEWPMVTDGFSRKFVSNKKLGWDWIGFVGKIYRNPLSGWWFQTFFIFHFIYGIILPIDFDIFQDGYCTTNQSFVHGTNHGFRWRFSQQHQSNEGPFFRGVGSTTNQIWFNTENCNL